MIRVIEADETAQERQEIHEKWKRDWDALTEEMSKVWLESVSAADVISEMRNARGQGFILEEASKSAETNLILLHC